MNELQIFNYTDKPVRTISKDGEPWFVAKDVCDVLEISNGRDAVARLDEDEKGVVSTDTLGGKQNMTIISESGVYALAFTSRKEEAANFKRWVRKEVIPSIRKYGMYARDELLDNPDLLIEVATKLKEERQARIAAEAKIQELAPAADLGNAVKNNDGLIIIREYVKILSNAGIRIKQCYLFDWLVKNGYLFRNGRGDYIPVKRFVDQGLFKLQETPVKSRTGSFISYTTKLTGKGQEYFIGKLRESVYA